MRFNFLVVEYDICKNPLVIIGGVKRHVFNAESYGEVESYYLILMNPLVVDYQGESDYSEEEENDIYRDVETAREIGYDSFVAIDTFDGENELDQYVALYPEQIRIANSFSKKFVPLII